MNQKIIRFLPFLLFFLVAVNWYFSSRITVDDAFITWRYGKNIVEHGMWGYNKDYFDLTQAYTNPIFAVISIIPAKLNFDVVLFFKIFSSIQLVAFLIWSKFIFKNNYSWILFFIAIPASMVHLYAGLETFTYVWVVGAMLIEMDKGRKNSVLILATVSFFLRPESWVLIGLLPLYFLWREDIEKFEFKNLLELKLITDRFKCKFRALFILLAFLIVPISIFWIFNFYYFGYIFPNTFYIKVSGLEWDPLRGLINIIFICPLMFFSRGKKLVKVIAFPYFIAVTWTYILSELAMDYSGRFFFHIYGPLFIYYVYLLNPVINIKEIFADKFRNLFYFSLLVFLLFSNCFGLHDATYYPRLLNAHNEIGKILKKEADAGEIQSFAFGDAGSAAFIADIRALDLIGLASQKVAHRGVNEALLDEYNPDVLVLHGDRNWIIGKWGHPLAMKWAKDHGLQYQCPVIWHSWYWLHVYSRKPIAALNELCQSSLKHDTRDVDNLDAFIWVPPWKFWHL